MKGVNEKKVELNCMRFKVFSCDELKMAGAGTALYLGSFESKDDARAARFVSMTCASNGNVFIVDVMLFCKPGIRVGHNFGKRTPLLGTPMARLYLPESNLGLDFRKHLQI
jgi:hypothetical protein